MDHVNGLNYYVRIEICDVCNMHFVINHSYLFYETSLVNGFTITTVSCYLSVA